MPGIGKAYTGFEAIEQSRKDKINQLHPASTARSELRYLMNTTAPRSLDDIFTGGPGGLSGSSQLIDNDPLGELFYILLQSHCNSCIVIVVLLHYSTVV